MPGGIYSARDERIRFQVGFDQCTVVCNDRSGTVFPHVELHTPGIVVLVGMAVDTLCMFHIGVHHITVNDAFIEAGQIALVEGQVPVSDIRRTDEAVGEVRVYVLFGYMDFKWPAARPLSVVFHKDFHVERATFGRSQHVAPLRDGGSHFPFVRGPFSSGIFDAGCVCVSLLVYDETQRGYVRRYRHVCIVGINVRCVLTFRIGIRHLGVASKTKGGQPTAGQGLQNVSNFHG